MSKNKTKIFELNLNSLDVFKPHTRNEREMIMDVVEALRAIYYLFSLMDIGIDEELYNKLDDDSKKYFKLKNE